jgi:hypothetical protein
MEVDFFEGINRRIFDFSFRLFDVLSLILTELFFHIMTIMITYETVITINGTRYREIKRK